MKRSFILLIAFFNFTSWIPDTALAIKLQGMLIASNARPYYDICSLHSFFMPLNGKNILYNWRALGFGFKHTLNLQDVNELRLVERPCNSARSGT